MKDVMIVTLKKARGKDFPCYYRRCHISPMIRTCSIVIMYLLLTTVRVFAQQAPQLVINEIAYRGTVASGTDEWIELFNTSESALDLDGWKFFISDRELALKGSIAPSGFFLLERTNDQVVSDIPANQIFTGSLTDSGVVLKIMDPHGQIVDQVSKWFVNLDPPPAGFSMRSSMERVDPFKSGDDPINWAINNQTTRNGTDAKGNVIFGTPKMRNSVTSSPAPQPLPEPSLPTPAPAPSPQPPLAPPSDSSTLAEALSEPAIGGRVEWVGMTRIIISRFLANPKGKDDDNEWVELKNTGASPLDLTGYQLDNREGGSKPFALTGVLAAGKTLRFFSRDTQITLRNSADQIRLRDPKGNIIDELEWKTEIREGVVMLRQDLSFTPDTAVVLGTVDGDTIKVEMRDSSAPPPPLPPPVGRNDREEGTTETVRLIGIDAPESVHPNKPQEFFGKEAAEYTRQELTGKTIRLEYGIEKRDAYGRLLAFIFLDSRHFNAELVEKGFARAYLQYPFQYAEAFKKLEEEAKAKKVGLWAQGVGGLSTSIDTQPSPSHFEPFLTRILKQLNALFRKLFGASNVLKGLPEPIRSLQPGDTF